MTITVFLVSLLGAMALGIPISFALLVCGAALMLYLNMFDAQILAQNVIHGADSYPMLAVPFFLLAGEIMNVGGLSRRIVELALALVGHIKGGKLRPLAVTGSTRSPQLPDVPTVAEQGVAGYEAYVWMGLLAPRGTPPAPGSSSTATPAM